MLIGDGTPSESLQSSPMAKRLWIDIGSEIFLELCIVARLVECMQRAVLLWNGC